MDDYNEQIRNSPDLQNRPAPRRRTNGPATPGSATAGGPTTTPPPPGVIQPSSVSPRKRPSLSSGSPNSSSGSESPLLIHSHSGPDLDAAGSSSVVQLSSSTNFLDSSSTQIKVEESKPAGNKPILRQIMVPPALAASLQATGKQLVFITGAGGKKVIAMRPMVQQTSSPTTTTMVKTARIVAGNSPVQTLNSPTRVTLASSTSVPSPPPLAANSPTMAISSNPTVCSPSPPSLGSQEESHRPMTPILGIPMELTPGQIMEAEISATLDDDDVTAQETPTSTSSGLCLRDPDNDLQSDTLPDNLFTPDQPSLSPTTVHKPPVITEETEVDTDDVEAEDEASSVVSTVMKRKRLVSGGTASTLEAEAAASSPTKRSRQNVVNSATGMRTRQRNLSSHMQKNKSGIIGITTTESSRSSIKK